MTTVFRNGAFKKLKMLSEVIGALIQQDWCLCKKRKLHRRSLFMQTRRKGHVKTREKVAVCIPRTGLSRCQPCTLILDVYPPELWENEFLFSKHAVCDSLLWLPKQTNTWPQVDKYKVCLSGGGWKGILLLQLS